ncbi:hypothetical protein [Marinobacter sp. X15-166B]|uniref:hypothetical protein n=1 Tax=Marinobacter sp. X15-166B TaxID=1897620 RepID=UPI00085C130D|nr:hypothetical protein [Marinobacter sp. X15-166B]OEY66873.1 hypothetical protein BG841_10680 [Marinobacter sp. X15-166B]
MIIRIFLALLVLNLVTFVVRAEASEQIHKGALSADVYVLQEQMSGDFERTEQDEWLRVGSRLLNLGFSKSARTGRSYASHPAQADHGIALLQQGACLNLKWKF